MKFDNNRIIGSSFSIPVGLSKLYLPHQWMKFYIDYFVLYDVNKWNLCGYFIWIHSIPSNNIGIASTTMESLYISVVTVKSIFKSTYWYLFSFQKERVVLKCHIFVPIGICESKHTSFSEIRGLFRNNWLFPKFDDISQKGANIEISQLFRNRKIFRNHGVISKYLSISK
jgi:hypothetical protein